MAQQGSSAVAAGSSGPMHDFVRPACAVCLGPACITLHDAMLDFSRERRLQRHLLDLRLQLPLRVRKLAVPDSATCHTSFAALIANTPEADSAR